jgi:alpha-1,6-mannosyltransferase
VVLVQISLQRRYSAESLGLDIGWMSSTLLILATPWLMPWYASILLPVTALNIEDRRFVFTSLAFCLSSSGYYVLISTGVIQSWFVVGFPFLVLGVEMIMSRSKKYVT